jgi:hypothetical protein
MIDYKNSKLKNKNSANKIAEGFIALIIFTSAFLWLFI